MKICVKTFLSLADFSDVSGFVEDLDNPANRKGSQAVKHVEH